MRKPARRFPTLALLLFTSPWLCASRALAAPPTAAPSTAAAEWNQFRGPDRSGVSHETGLQRSWPEEGPKILWRRPLGEGFSGLSVVGERLCTMFALEEEEYLGCFNATTGEPLWRTAIGGKFHEMFGNGPRATPTIDGDTLYAVGGKGRVVAADLATGAIRWQLELSERYGIYDPQTLNPMATQEGLQLPLYGYSGSPLVEGDLLVVETGARHGRSVVGLDKKTGAEIWTALDDEIGYSSPIAVEIGGRRQILLLPGTSIVALAPSGEVLWRHGWELTPSQPLFVPPDKIFVSTVSGVGAVLLQVGPEDAPNRITEVWKIQRLKNAWNSSIIAGGHLYGFDNATLRCVSLADGSLAWAARGLGRAR
ncbi:MAG: PQQ-binding-like beta-propeller repeat protein [Thermoanaerobaculia bacterium]|nr:PQQ-binding-like beta-propeller repeat protein [Thermoanaerobaculia bacterium]